MNENRDDEPDVDARGDVPVTPEGLRAEAAVRALPAPEPTEAFRARLRGEFIAGTVPAAAESAGASAAAASPRRRTRQGWRWALAGGVAAALLAFVLLRPGSPPADDWTIVGVGGTGAGSILIDGREHEVATLRAGGSTIPAGARIELPESTTIELRRADALALETAPGSSFTLPRWERRGGKSAPLVGAIDQGEVRYVTGPGFAGSRLRIGSPEAVVEVAGTTFSVIRDSSGTCVCVESGRVRIDAADAAAGWDVPAGRRRVIFVDARPSQEMPLYPGEAMKLQMFRDRSLPELDRARP